MSTTTPESVPNLSDEGKIALEKEYSTEIKDVWDSYEYKKKRKQSKVGVVVSTKCAKTINVEYPYMKYYSKYNVSILRHRRLMAHDEEMKAQLGDVVRIVPCRPRSRMKRHELIDIVRRPRVASAIPLEPVKEQS